MTSNAELMGQTLDGIANAIRVKRGVFYNIKMVDMAEEIMKITSTTETIVVYAPDVTFPNLSVSAAVTATPVPEASTYGAVDLSSIDVVASVSIE